MHRSVQAEAQPAPFLGCNPGKIGEAQGFDIRRIEGRGQGPLEPRQFGRDGVLGQFTGEMFG